MSRSQRIRILFSQSHGNFWKQSQDPRGLGSSIPNPMGRIASNSKIPEDPDPPFPDPNGITGSKPRSQKIRIFLSQSHGNFWKQGQDPKGSGSSCPSPSSLPTSLGKIPDTPELPTVLYFSLRGTEPRGTNQLWHENQGTLPGGNREPLEDAEIPPWNHQEVSPKPPLRRIFLEFHGQRCL